MANVRFLLNKSSPLLKSDVIIEFNSKESIPISLIVIPETEVESVQLPVNVMIFSKHSLAMILFFKTQTPRPKAQGISQHEN